LMQNLSTTKDKNTGNEIRFTATLREVRIATGKTTLIEKAKKTATEPNATDAPVDKGSGQTPPASDALQATTNDNNSLLTGSLEALKVIPVL